LSFARDLAKQENTTQFDFGSSVAGNRSLKIATANLQG
jgi:hypothetical protein